MDSEKVGHSEQGSVVNESLWGDSYKKDLPAFNPDQGEVQGERLSDEDVAMKLFGFSGKRQNELMEQLRQADGERAERLQEQLEYYIEQDNHIVAAMAEMDSLDVDKSLDEIFASEEKQEQKAIDALKESGKWETTDDDQRKSMVRRRNQYSELREWVVKIRDGEELGFEKMVA